MAPSKPKNLDPKVFKKNLPKGLTIDPKTAVYIEFAHNHYIHYPKLNMNSKDAKVMRERVNMIRQLTTGIKKSSKAINDAMKASKDKDAQAWLMGYLELLRTAERDRQNWIKFERGLGNKDNLKEMIESQGLDDVIRI